MFTLAKQQDALENELTALAEELERLGSESARLCSQYPETKEHIETRLEDADTTYNDLLQQLQSRKEKIQQSQASFLLANEFNELTEWLRDMQAKVTSGDLNSVNNSTMSAAVGEAAGEVGNAELLIKKHRELKVEIDLQQPKIQKFIAKSDELQRSERKAFSSKVDAIRSTNKNLLDAWQSRHDLYEQNLEYNKLLREIKLLDSWLSSKDSFVNTDLLGDNVQSVEALLKQHDDFEGMLVAMETRFNNLKKENKLERTLREIRQRELENKAQQEKNFEQEKRKEQERKRKMEKRRQDDRRRTQEIISIVTQPSSQAATQQVIVPIELSESEAKKSASSFTKNIEAISNMAEKEVF